MNRRDFIKSAGLAATIPAISLTCKYEDDEKGPEKESRNGYRWDYRVYCYERQQGEWTFSENIKGSFAPEREYMTCEVAAREGLHASGPYAGWMDGGKLHFVSLEEAQDFVEMHVKAKDDTNLIDSVYDIYYVDWDNLEYESCQPTEMQVAHYWFNGDTGRQIHWVEDKPHTDWSKVECA